MADKPNKATSGRWVREVAAPVPTPGRTVSEGEDYSTTLRLLAQLQAVKPPAPQPAPPPKKSK